MNCGVRWTSASSSPCSACSTASRSNSRSPLSEYTSPSADNSVAGNPSDSELRKRIAHRHRLAGLDALALEHLLKQAHRLEELEAVWFGQQLLGYARIDSPLRAGHRTISSPLSPDTSTSRVKLLACT